MKDTERLIESLHPLERQVLPVLHDNISVNDIIRGTKLKEVEVMRALQWLEGKGIINTNKELKSIINLDKNGLIYKEKGLPERRFLEVLEKQLSLQEISQKAGLNKDELNISLGLLKKRSAINISKKISITEKGKELTTTQFLEELFLERLPLEASGLNKEDEFAFNELKKRKEIIKVDTEKVITVNLSALGRNLVKAELKYDLIDALTPAIIKQGTWRLKKFRRYDLKTNVPRIQFGRRHFVNEATNYIKKIWLEMGFKEMEGPMLDSSFWNFDALFTAQDHPVREMQDTFFIKGKTKLPNANIISRVKAAHENGYTTGSRGWGYKWDEEEAKRLVLRTHTTVLSARTLADLKKEDLPAKFFAVGRVFRNEALDWSHLFELTQVEGIVVSDNANFRHLIGYLKEFYKKLGYEKIRVRPSYFPYTEPSLEIEVFHPVKNVWVELGGAGIFRPEVVKPLMNMDVTVLAWGQGLERGIGEYYNISDIREIYKNDLKQLRNMKIWMG